MDVLFGVWIPGHGWLRNGSNVFADPHKEVAQEVARYIGLRSRVRYVDKSITDFEQLYLDKERASKWHIWTNYKNSKK